MTKPLELNSLATKSVFHRFPKPVTVAGSIFDSYDRNPVPHEATSYAVAQRWDSRGWAVTVTLFKGKQKIYPAWSDEGTSEFVAGLTLEHTPTSAPVVTINGEAVAA